VIIVECYLDEYLIKDEQSETSDVDILISFHEGASLIDFAGISYFLEEKLNLIVDIVPVDTIRNEIRKKF
jgi:predicted nucleotidyltransferase